MTKEEMLKRLEFSEGIIGYMYGKQRIIVCDVDFPDGKAYADRLLFIKKEDLRVYEDGLFYQWGFPGPDWNFYYFNDYGITWAFTKDEIEPNPYPKEEDKDYDIT